MMLLLGFLGFLYHVIELHHIVGICVPCRHPSYQHTVGTLFQHCYDIRQRTPRCANLFGTDTYQVSSFFLTLYRCSSLCSAVYPRVSYRIMYTISIKYLVPMTYRMTPATYLHSTLAMNKSSSSISEHNIGFMHCYVDAPTVWSSLPHNVTSAEHGS